MALAHVSRHPAILHNLTRLRAQDTPPREFRAALRRLSVLLAVEATADLATAPSEITTPLTKTTGQQYAESLALVPILRAGLGMSEALDELFPDASVRHLGFFRDETKLVPVPYYNKLGKARPEDLCLVLDPMLATGGSAIAAIDALKGWGARRIKFVGILGAPEGVEALHGAHADVDIHLGAVDERLNERGYIVPGLGDAGDRLFAT